MRLAATVLAAGVIAVAVPATAQADGGLTRVILRDGTELLTHGGDPLLAPIAPTEDERAPVCASDYYQHVLYGHPLTKPDRVDDVRATLRLYIRRMNAKLAEEGAESGRPVDYKFRCDSSGQPRVDSFTGPISSSFPLIVQAARDAGFASTRVKYVIFWDGDHRDRCGFGSVHRDQRLALDNRNNTGGSYGVTFRSCWAGTTPMHELGHNQGAVQPGAPHWSGYIHCNDERDVMCYADGGSESRIFTRCNDRDHFDCGHDTYFDTSPEPGEWLASRWNIGWSGNRFLAFGGDQRASPPPPDDESEADRCLVGLYGNCFIGR